MAGGLYPVNDRHEEMIRTTGITDHLRIDYDNREILVSARVRRAGPDYIVFLHRLGCAKAVYRAAFTARELRDYSLVAFDFPGHGTSPSLDGIPHSLDVYADITNTLIQRLTTGEVFIIGHSMGGAVGLIAASRRNCREPFISVEGNLVSEDCGLASRAMAAQSTGGFISEGFLQCLRSLENSTRRDFQIWSRWYGQANPAALHESASSLVKWSDSGQLIDLFNSFTKKVYLYGDQSLPSKNTARHLDNTSTFSIPNAEHFSMISNPEAFYRTVAASLAST